MKKYNVIILLILVTFTLYNCKHEIIKQEPTITPVTNVNNGVICDSDSVYFNRDVMPIIQANCAVSGCHGGGDAKDGVDLTTYSKIISTGDIEPFDPNDSDLYEAITETDPDKIMPEPPNDPLSAEEIAIIKKWIEQGAPNNYCNECDTAQASFSANIQPIIANNCGGCHGNTNPSAGISLTNYANISAMASNGMLSDVINHNPGVVAMPYLGNKLNSCFIYQIEKWISEGIQNN